jgi:hypothetical protein
VVTVPVQRSGWRPLRAVPPGELLPCGSNAAGTHREFFAHRDDVPGLLADGIWVTEHGTRKHFLVRLTPTPLYANGDVQIECVVEAG